MESRVRDLKGAFSPSAPLELKFVEFAERESLAVHRSASKLSKSLTDSLGELAGDLNLRIRVAQAHCRGSFFEEGYAAQYFEALRDQILEELGRFKNILGDEDIRAVREFAETYSTLAIQSNQKRVDNVQAYLGHTEQDPLILLRTSTLRKRASASFSENKSGNFEIPVDLRVLTDGEVINSARILVIGAPIQIVASAQLAKYFRYWVTSGYASSVEFVAPVWAPKLAVREFENFVFPGLPWKLPGAFEQVVIEDTDVTTEVLDREEFVSGESDVVGEFSPDSASFDRLLGGGEIDCVLVRCGGGMIFPVQVGSSTVSGISRLELDNSEPKVAEIAISSLAPGDVILARADSSEQVALRRRVLERIGSVGEEFVETQLRWKGLLRSKNTTGDWVNVSRLLDAETLSISPRPAYWAEELSFGPRAPDDFFRLMSFLGLDHEFAVEALNCRNLVWAESIREGQAVRSILQRSLNEEHISLLKDGKAVEIENPDLGDANYIFAPVEIVSAEIALVKSGQVRKFVVDS